MKEYRISENEAGQRLDKYLHKLLREAPSGFLYKMLRKKNITLNGKKAQGSELLCTEDVVCFFLAEETFRKFQGQGQVAAAEFPLKILYEDPHVLLVHKPAGILSMPAKGEGYSMVEYITGYLLREEALKRADLATFHPSVCNRLDRNTSGILTAGKSLPGLQALSEAFRAHRVEKSYLCLTLGRIEESQDVKGYLQKDEKRNKVSVRSFPDGEGKEIETRITPLAWGQGVTLAEVLLLTGRPHQIRAQLAALGHPVAGDGKYGDPSRNRYFLSRYGLKNQLLHAYRLRFARQEGVLAGLSGQEFTDPPPALFARILKEELE